MFKFLKFINKKNKIVKFDIKRGQDNNMQIALKPYLIIEKKKLNKKSYFFKTMIIISH